MGTSLYNLFNALFPFSLEDVFPESRSRRDKEKDKALVRPFERQSASFNIISHLFAAWVQCTSALGKEAKSIKRKAREETKQVQTDCTAAAESILLPVGSITPTCRIKIMI